MGIPFDRLAAGQFTAGRDIEFLVLTLEDGA
jgi:hypothetical protein